VRQHTTRRGPWPSAKGGTALCHAKNKTRGTCHAQSSTSPQRRPTPPPPTLCWLRTRPPQRKSAAKTNQRWWQPHAPPLSTAAKGKRQGNPSLAACGAGGLSRGPCAANPGARWPKARLRAHPRATSISPRPRPTPRWGKQQSCGLRCSAGVCRRWPQSQKQSIGRAPPRHPAAEARAQKSARAFLFEFSRRDSTTRKSIRLRREPGGTLTTTWPRRSPTR
jgi:hypothetical protein